MSRLLLDTPIPSKITIVFGTIIAVALLMTAIVLQHETRMHALSDDIRSRQYVAIHALADIQALGERLYGIEGHNLLTSDADDIRRSDAAAEKVFASYRLLDQKYLPLIRTPQERALYDETRTLWLQLERHYRQLMRLRDSGDTAAAEKLYHDNIENMMDKFRTLTHDIEGLQLEALSTLTAEMTEALQSNRQSVIYAVTAIVLICLLAAWAMCRTISRPVQDLTRLMRDMSAGALDTAVPSINRRDEIGQMAAALDVFRRNSLEARRLAAEKERRTEKIEQLLGGFDTSVSGVLKTVAAAATELESTAGEMSAVANETNRQAATTETAARETSANVQTVAAATEEITASLSEISRQVERATAIVNTAVRQAQETDNMVGALETAAQKIGDIVRLISDIAEQTNLLALNATIEAARAGDAGRGFAVVAAEIKSLAGQTATATGDISSQISAIQQSTTTAVQAIRQMLATIRSVNDSTSTIAAAVQEQNAATAEIAESVGYAANGSRGVSENILHVNTAAMRTGTASVQVLSAARELSRESETLKQKVDQFFRDIRIA